MERKIFGISGDFLFTIENGEYTLYRRISGIEETNLNPSLPMVTAAFFSTPIFPEPYFKTEDISFLKSPETAEVIGINASGEWLEIDTDSLTGWICRETVRENTRCTSSGYKSEH